MNKKNIGTIKGLFLSVIIVCFSAGALIGCSNSRMNFVVALQAESNPMGSIRSIVTSLDDWIDLDFSARDTGLTEKFVELDFRYDKQFFSNNALIVFTFGAPNGGIRINEIQLRKVDNEIKLEVNFETGLTERISHGIVILEINNEFISENTTLNAIAIRKELIFNK